MATDCIPQLAFKFDKLVVAKFDAEHASSDGGAVLLKAVDRQLGVTATIDRCLREPSIASLLTVALVEALKRAGARPVTVTAKGIRY